MLFIKTHTNLTYLFYRFLSFLFSSQKTIQLEIYKVKNSFGSSIAFATLLTNSREDRDSSIVTNLSKYLI
jgi:hypothetical protein